MSVEERARKWLDKQNPFAAGLPEIIMRKHWLYELMGNFAKQERTVAVREFAEMVAGRILKLDVEPITTMEDTFREMFNEDL